MTPEQQRWLPSYKHVIPEQYDTQAAAGRCANHYHTCNQRLTHIGNVDFTETDNYCTRPLSAIVMCDKVTKRTMQGMPGNFSPH